jgi:hypothetical protein
MPDINDIAHLDDDDNDYYDGTKPMGRGLKYIRALLWKSHLETRAKVATMGGMWVRKCDECFGPDNQACTCFASAYSPTRFYFEQYSKKIFEEGKRKQSLNRLEKRSQQNKKS